MKSVYGFTPELAFDIIKNHFTDWFKTIGVDKVLVGISGGKDSTVVASMFKEILGAKNVIGVSLPNEVNNDSEYVDEVFKFTGIEKYELDIGPAVSNILFQLKYSLNKEPSVDTNINLPCRLRTACLYAYAQSLGAIVLNTSNLTEDLLGYATLWGDTCGSYAPIQGLTVTEVKELGYYLNVPKKLVDKIPSDGLQDKTDEDRLGLKYADVDDLIRYGEGNEKLVNKVNELYNKNKFKISMINLPGVKFISYPNYIVGRPGYKLVTES